MVKQYMHVQWYDEGTGPSPDVRLTAASDLNTWRDKPHECKHPAATYTSEKAVCNICGADMPRASTPEPKYHPESGEPAAIIRPLESTPAQELVAKWNGLAQRIQTERGWETERAETYRDCARDLAVLSARTAPAEGEQAWIFHFTDDDGAVFVKLCRSRAEIELAVINDWWQGDDGLDDGGERMAPHVADELVRTGVFHAEDGSCYAQPTAIDTARPVTHPVVSSLLRPIYAAASKGFHITETCGPESKYHHVIKFRTLGDLHGYEDAWRAAMIASRGDA